MLVMFSIIALIVIGAMAVEVRVPHKGISDGNHKGYIFLICLVLGLQSALRSLNVGPDTLQYLNRYEAVKFSSWQNLLSNFINYYFQGNTVNCKDPGYDLLEKAFQLLGFNYRLWLCFVAIVFFSAFAYFLYKNTRNASEACIAFLLYLVLYYSFFSITGLRQTLAQALCLWAFECARRKKALPFFVLVLIASTLHKSALVFLPAFILIRVKNPRRLLSLAFIFLPVGFTFRSQIVSAAGILLGYENYTVGFSGAGAYNYAILSLLAAILVWWKSKELCNQYVGLRECAALFSVSIIVIPALWIDPSIMRIAQYYSFYILVVIPAVLSSLGSPSLSASGNRAGRSDLSGHLGVLCSLFLLAYCCQRFIGYDYSFFFLQG